MTTRLLIRVLITLVVLAPMFLYNRGDLSLPFLDRLEAFAYDVRLLISMPQQLDDRIVIVDIDERSLAAEGQWPWARNKLARLVDQLFDHYQVQVVGFDIVFAEPDRGSGLAVLSSLAADELRDDQAFVARLPELQRRLDWDGHFAASLRDRNTVLGYIFRDTAISSSTGTLPPPTLTHSEHQTEVGYSDALTYTANYAVLQEAARASGFFDNPMVDADGVYRRVPILQSFRGDLYESLALAVTRVAAGLPQIDFTFGSPEGRRDSLNLEWLTLGPYRIPVDGQAAVLVPYRGPVYSFPYVSAAEVLHARAPLYPLKGAIVLVGTSAPGLHDMRVTPVGNKFHGVEIHANIISGILDQRIKHHPAYTQGIEIVQLLLVALLMTWIVTRANPLLATLLTVLLMVGLVGANQVMWNRADFVIPIAPTLVFAFAVFFLQMIYGYFAEIRRLHQFSTLFGQYVPPELVEEMGRNSGRFSMESEIREMTVMFTDVRGFTGIAEGLEPRELSELMNEFLTRMTRVIHRHRGTIDKYMGDAIMAFWGAPLNDADHARHALQAGLEMQGALRELAPMLKRRGWPPIRVGIGINTGGMRVGNMGSEFRTAYTVMGDAVNLAARLEGLTRSYAVDIVVGQTTVEALSDLAFLELDLVRVRGKDRPVAIYEPIGSRGDLGPDLKAMLSQHRRALRWYRSADWDNAERTFFELHQRWPDRRVFQTYLDRIAYFRANPPPADWDGVFVHESKRKAADLA